jgi:hypothetical protein
MSKWQSVVALSTTEAEYMVATHGSKEAVWMQKMCSGIGFEQRAMKMTKHIDVQYHFVRHMVESNKVLLEKVDTLENIVDSLTVMSRSQE